MEYHQGMNFNAWIEGLIGSDTQRQASRKANLAESTLSRQLSRGHLRPEMVIALCRAYGRSPVTGLVETGYINSWETEGVAIPYALQQATNEQILSEILRRSDPEARIMFGAEDVPGIVDLDPDTQEGFKSRLNNHD